MIAILAILVALGLLTYPAVRGVRLPVLAAMVTGGRRCWRPTHRFAWQAPEHALSPNATVWEGH